MPKKVSLTPAQIALAESDINEGPGMPWNESANIKDDGLEEIPEGEGQPDEELPPEGDADYYEQVRDGAETDDEPGETDDEPKDKEWLTDELKTYGMSYGLTEEEVTAFDSAEDLQRFGDMTDRRVAQQRYSQYQEPEPKPTKKPGEEETEEPEEPAAEEIDYDAMIAKMEEDNYDETSIALARNAKALAKNAKHQQEMLRRLEERDRKREEEWAKSREEAALGQDVAEFDGILDELDPALFGMATKDGNVVQLSPGHYENRRAVYAQEARIKEEMKQSGREIQVPRKVLVARAARAVFGELQPERTKKVEAQSRRRRPTGANRGQNGGASPPARGGADPGDDDVSAIAQSPKIRAFWEKTQRANGQV
jgi:hypothetical protein